MALTRKFLAALGIEQEKIDEIISSHSETVEALKAQRDEYKASADKLQGVTLELESLKRSGGADTYKEKYNALKDEFEKYKEEAEAREAHSKIEQAYKRVLRDAGIAEKRIDAVLKVSDLKDIKLDDGGSVRDKEALINDIRLEWSDFIVKEETKGADTSTPPDNTGGSPLTKKDILAIKDTAERQAMIAKHIDLFTKK